MDTGTEYPARKNMITLLKAIISILALLAFIYAANLAMQGSLEMKIIMHDYTTAKSYLSAQLQLLIEKYL